MNYSVLGASGFIGSRLLHTLGEAGYDYHAYSHEEEATLAHRLGHVIDCAGVTSDFRVRPFDAVRAHVSRVMDLIERCEFDSYLYLSSTRVYRRVTQSREDVELLVDPHRFDDIYATSKLMGESIVLTHPRSTFRVARLSNVYGRGSSSLTFLNSVIASAVETGEIRLGQTLDSERDYVAIEDVLPLLIRIVRHGKNRIYNIASGRNVSNQQILDVLKDRFGCKVSVQERAESIRFPRICIDRIQSEFGFEPAHILDRISQLLDDGTRAHVTHRH